MTGDRKVHSPFGFQCIDDNFSIPQFLYFVEKMLFRKDQNMITTHKSAKYGRVSRNHLYAKSDNAIESVMYQTYD